MERRHGPSVRGRPPALAGSASGAGSRLLRLAGAAAALRALPLLAALAASPAGAQTVLDLDPSVRAAGAGGASNAVFWGGDPSAWANPALLGYDRGLRYDYGRTRLVPDLAPDVWFETQRFRAGIGGVGVLLAGKPDGLGKIDLDYGRSAGTDPSGNPITYHAFERVQTWGAGVSLAELASSIMRLAGSRPPEFLRRFDVAAGMTRKDALLVLDPGIAAGGTRATDVGLLLRVTPFDSFEGAAPPAPHPWRWPRARDPRARDPHERPFPIVGRPRTPGLRRLDLAYGFSIQDANDATITFGDAGSAPAPRIYRHGLAARFISGAASRRGGPGARSTPAPPLAAGLSADLEHIQPRAAGERSYDVRRYGAELMLANMLSLRAGYVDDRQSRIRGVTTGMGLSYQLANYAGARWDWAHVPQVNGLRRLERHGFTLWLDPIAMMKAARSRG